MCRTMLGEQSLILWPMVSIRNNPSHRSENRRIPVFGSPGHQLRYFHAKSETCAKWPLIIVGMVRSTEYSDIDSHFSVFPAPVPSSPGLPFAEVQNTKFHLARILTSKYSESPATRPATHRVLGKSARVPRSTAQWLSPRCIMKVSRLP